MKSGIWCICAESVYIGAMNTNQSPPTRRPYPAKIRLTIAVTPEVYDTFSRFAKVGNMSIGGAMNAWMEDTREGAELLTSTMERARAAPALVIREINSYALSMSDENEHLIDRIRKKGAEDRAKGASAHSLRHPAPPTPPSNTGVTTTKNKPKRGTK